MADNFTANPGSGGAVFASDDVAGVQWPRVKISFGVDGVATDVSGTDPLPVTVLNFPATQAVTQSGVWTVGITGMKAEDSAAVSGDLGLPILAMRQAADTTSTDTDGDYTMLKMDEEGRLKVATKPASFAIVTGNITASAQTVFCDVSRASNVMLMMNTSSLAGHNCTFEGSIDSTNGTDGVWFGVQAVRTNANTIETTTGVLAATPAYAWEMSCNGLSFVRVRATAHTSGTATWKFQRGSYATEPIPAAQISGTQPVSGTVTANIGTGSIAAGTNAIGDVGIQYRANATGAASINQLIAGASTNPTVVKASAGRLLGFVMTNNATAVRYLKFHNQATSPTAGTGVVQTYGIPPNGGTVAISIPGGVAFTTGIALTTVTGPTAADSTAVAANDLVGTIHFA